jgi:hypothetical protein
LKTWTYLAGSKGRLDKTPQRKLSYSELVLVSFLVELYSKVGRDQRGKWTAQEKGKIPSKFQQSKLCDVSITKFKLGL